MNICPICDSPIQDRWCKRCFRFVTPLEIPGEIHLNMEHDLKHETNCEYHDTADLNQKPDSKYKQEIEERRRQMEARQNAAKPASSQKTDNSADVRRQQKAAKRRKRRNAFFARLIVLAVIIGTIYYMEPRFFGEAWKLIQQVRDGGWENIDLSDWISEPYTPQPLPANPAGDIDRGKEDSQGNSAEVTESTAAILKKLDTAFVPVKSYETEINGHAGTIYEYAQADIEEFAMACDGFHMEKTYQDILDVINNGNTVYYVDMNNIFSPNSDNILFDTGTYAISYFSEYHEIYGDDVDIWLEADTATKQLHNMEITTQDLDAIGFQVAAYEILNAMVPGHYQGLGAMMEDFRQAVWNREELHFNENGYEISFHDGAENSLVILPETAN